MSGLKKILIVDDEEDLCLLLKIFFTRKKYHVEVANNLKDGMKQIEQWHPDILFLDNNLPDGLGWEKAPQLLDNYPTLTIHLISAFRPTMPDELDGSKLTIWEKPISLKALDHFF